MAGVQRPVLHQLGSNLEIERRKKGCWFLYQKYANYTMAIVKLGEYTSVTLRYENVR